MELLEVLLMFSTALKDLAVELDVFIMTSTQINANGDDNKNIKNEASLSGGRSTINKADIGAIMSRVTKEELELIKEFSNKFGEPNIVTDIYKVRSGEYNQLRVWSSVDLGNLRKIDLFVTDSRLQALKDFNYSTKFFYEDSESNNEELNEKLCQLNELTDF